MGKTTFVKTTIFGTDYDLFPMVKCPERENVGRFVDARNNNAFTVFILPGIMGDIRICAYSSKAEIIPPPHGAMIAAALFLVSYRGLPLDEVEVESDSKICKVFFDQKANKISIILPKCKLLLEKTQEFTGNIEKSIKKIALQFCKKIAVAVSCHDADMFDKEHLISMIMNTPNADFAVAYSPLKHEIKTGNQREIKKDDKCEVKITDIHEIKTSEKCEIETKHHFINPIPDQDLLSVLAAYEAVGKREDLTIKLADSLLTLTPTYNGTKVTLSPPTLMPFSTPFI